MPVIVAMTMDYCRSISLPLTLSINRILRANQFAACIETIQLGHTPKCPNTAGCVFGLPPTQNVVA
jgi:hypothetical protein